MNRKHLTKTTGILIFLAVVFMSGSCTANAQEVSPVAFLYANDGAQMSLKLIVDIGGSRQLFDAPANSEKLTVPSELYQPWTAYNKGDFLVITDEKENKTMVYGSYFYTEVVSGGIKRTIPVFSGKGNGGGALGSVPRDGAIFLKGDDNEAVMIAQIDYKKVTIDGKTDTIDVTRFVDPESEWSFVRGNKIYQLLDSGEAIQKGWLEWRRIITGSGDKLVIIMTKGMSDDSKWTGIFNGVRYTD